MTPAVNFTLLLLARAGGACRLHSFFTVSMWLNESVEPSFHSLSLFVGGS